MERVTGNLGSAFRFGMATPPVIKTIQFTGGIPHFTTQKPPQQGAA
jgi:hypothetical protein